MDQQLIMVGMLALMILLLVQQNRRRKKDAQKLVESLTVGADIILHSGIKGKVLEINGDDLVIESTPKTKLLVVKGAVRAIAPAVTEAK